MQSFSEYLNAKKTAEVPNEQHQVPQETTVETPVECTATQATTEQIPVQAPEPQTPEPQTPEPQTTTQKEKEV